MLTKEMRWSRRLRYTAAVSGALVLLLTGCGEDQTHGTTTVDDIQGSVPTEREEGIESAQIFVAAFEDEGLTCAPADRLGSGVVEQFTCKGEDHLVMTIRNFEDITARDKQLEKVQDLACEIADSGQDIQRLSISDTWILMAGGDRDIDFEVFGNAMTSLGLESEDYTCS
ncbi:hypothetical protein GCM10025863_24920 [Microbacterium suwonense]|uniref:DUF3558 domain-containing protein n=1 Tax=Microbacterium suwonense TaxID=683047 RepID=A0ABN6X6V1_9MICO|nr:hypothetical protein GCM10025863_24920 [Microbacterium suwonense]